MAERPVLIGPPSCDGFGDGLLAPRLDVLDTVRVHLDGIADVGERGRSRREQQQHGESAANHEVRGCPRAGRPSWAHATDSRSATTIGTLRESGGRVKVIPKVETNALRW